MKLYIWEGVLTDRSSGMAVAVAKDLDQALALARQEGTHIAENLGGAEPEVIDLGRTKREAKLWYVYGGG